MNIFFSKLPTNKTKIYSQVYIKESDCILYVPANSIEEAKMNRDTVYKYFNDELHYVA